MSDVSKNVPTSESLQSGLIAVLSPQQVRVVGRERVIGESTFPCEIVTCELADGTARKLFIKYSGGYEWETYRHRGGVVYEAIVYRDVLSRMSMSTPRWHGNYLDPTTGHTWIVLECVEDAQRITKARLPLSAAAHWIGRFHRETEILLGADELALLNRYDADYYLGWARRAHQHTRGLHPRHPWLARLCGQFEELATELLTGRLAIIHGEYYPPNVLADQHAVRPVDWESAAVAAGEIDLASLTEFWSIDVIGECEAAYVEGRWPAGPPADFARVLGLARLYLHFRWLGDEEAWRLGDSAERIELLRVDADSLGLMSG